MLRNEGGVYLLTIMSTLIFMLVLKVTFKTFTSIIGLSFTILLMVLQIAGCIFLLPIMGLIFIVIDAVIVLIIIALAKVFGKGGFICGIMQN